MKAELCDPVIVIGPHANGVTTHPGVITRVWGEKLEAAGPMVKVNVHCFRDANPSLPLESIDYYESLAQANEKKARVPFCYPKPPKEA
jgi:hypothetical protein